MMAKHLVFIFDKPLHANVRAQEFFDIILMAAAFEQRVSLLFSAEGVYAPLKGQQPEALGVKNNSAIFQALSLYDVDDLYVEQAAIEARNVELDQLLVPMTVLSQVNINQLLMKADHIFSF